MVAPAVLEDQRRGAGIAPVDIMQPQPLQIWPLLCEVGPGMLILLHYKRAGQGQSGAVWGGRYITHSRLRRNWPLAFWRASPSGEQPAGFELERMAMPARPPFYHRAQ